VYGKPCSTGFGSPAFFEVSKMNMGLATIALGTYKLFMGNKWSTETEQPGRVPGNWYMNAVRVKRQIF
jgi:hypothetical protein